MIPIPPKLLLYGAVALALALAVGTIYGCGRKAQSDATALKVARQTIKVERQALKITNQIDMRVNAEGIQTATKAQEATREIEAIRQRQPVSGSSGIEQHGPADPAAGSGDSAGDAARVLQLAREARAAAVASSARLQPADTSAR